MTGISLSAAALYLALGATLGAAYFLLLLRTVRLHACQAPRRDLAMRVVPLYLMRVGMAVATFWVIAQQGALPLLLALLGFLAARLAVQRRVASE